MLLVPLKATQANDEGYLKDLLLRCMCEKADCMGQDGMPLYIPSNISFAGLDHGYPASGSDICTDCRL